MLRNDIICAIATPAGMGAIAVIRLSGAGCIDLSQKLYAAPNGKKLLAHQASHTAHFGVLKVDLEILDEVLITIFKAPHSFTGEESVEISCHGSPLIQQKILYALLHVGARLADPGEFTMRAFMNGKMDLSQAEAVADLIAAENDAAHRIALQQMRGGFSQEIDALREELINFAALIELELDFAEEDVAFANRDKLMELLQKIKIVLQRLIESFALGNVIKNGIPVAIVGAPNAGKSTLLNTLLNEERAIVSHIAGTTRDTIEDEIHLGGLSFRFIDTAGLRHATDEIERIGIEKAHQKIQLAQIVLYLYDATTANDETEKHMAEIAAIAGQKTFLVLANKVDAGQQKIEVPQNALHLEISAKHKTGITELQQALVDAVGQTAFSSNQTIVTNSRHYEALKHALAAITLVENGIITNLTTDLLAEDVREALRFLGNITGAIEPDRDILGTIFGKFCIGK